MSRDPSSGHWRWAGRAADGAHGETGAASHHATKEEAAAHAGAFLKEHAADRS
ncbi:hypothetical protein [Streptomyces sp. NPDC001415]